jgi:hypothetical protein
MGTKNNPGKFDCYEKALPDEPMFVLLARDPWMTYLVQEWARIRRTDIKSGERPESDMDMVIEAEHCANDAIKWRKENDGKWRK